MKYTFTRISNLLQVSTFLSVLCAGMGLYLLIETSIDYYQSQNETLRAGNIAAHIENKLSQYRTLLKLIAKKTDILDSIQGSESVRIKQEHLLQKEISYAIKVRLLHLKTNAIDTSEIPHMSYACLAMIRASGAATAPIPAEVHMLDTPSAHIALIQPMRDQNNNLMGFILVSLNPELLHDLLRQYPLDQGYAELRQNLTDKEPIVLATHGKHDVDTTQSSHGQAPVTDTNWSVAYWQDLEPWTLTSDMRPIFVYFGLSAVFLLLGPLLVHNLMRRTVEHDIKILTGMLNDIRSGKIASYYPIKLNELSLVGTQLQRSGGKLVQDQQALLKDGHKDLLTGVPNQKAFQIKLDQLHDHTKLGFPSSLLLADIEHLAEINDTYSHEAGDLVLKELASGLRDITRQIDLVSRLEDDTFGIIFSLTALPDIKSAMERLKSKMPFEVSVYAGKSIKINWSAGLSVMLASDTSADEVVQRALSALQDAKKGGGNQIIIFGSPPIRV